MVKSTTDGEAIFWQVVLLLEVRVVAFMQLESPTQMSTMPEVLAGNGVVSLISRLMSGLPDAEAQSHSARPKTPEVTCVDGIVKKLPSDCGTARPMLPGIMPLQLPPLVVPPPPPPVPPDCARATPG